MDRLPRDAALERRHHDIVRLLDEYKIGTPTTAAAMGAPGSTPTPLPFLPPSKQTKRRSKSKSDPSSPTKSGDAPKAKPRKKRSGGESSGVPHVRKTSASAVISSGSQPSSKSPPDYDSAVPPRYENAGMLLPGQQVVGLARMEKAGGGGKTPSLEDYAASARYNSSNFLHDWSAVQPSPHQQVLGASKPQGGSGPTVPLSPTKGKGLPTSPTHLQAMQQRAAQQQQQQQQHPQQHPHVQSFLFPAPTSGGSTDMGAEAVVPIYATAVSRKASSGQLTHPPPQHPHHHQYQPQQPLQPTSQQGYPLEQYPSPPSQHSQSNDSPPQHLSTLMPDHYLTPSPDSPDQWSSSSPRSAQSDWSEGISSPVPPIKQVPPPPKRVTDPVYLWPVDVCVWCVGVTLCVCCEVDFSRWIDLDPRKYQAVYLLIVPAGEKVLCVCVDRYQCLYEHVL